MKNHEEMQNPETQTGLTEFCPQGKLYDQAVRDLATVKSWAKQSKTLYEFCLNIENIGAECFRCDEDSVSLLYGVIQCDAYVCDDEENIKVDNYVDIWDAENEEWYMEYVTIPQNELEKYINVLIQ